MSKKWRQEHPEYQKEYYKEWLVLHPGYYKKWRKKHPGYFKEHTKLYQRKFRQTAKGKEWDRKHYAQRKQFGFIPLNDCFDDSSGHHIDMEKVIYIPTEMHEYNRHSITQDRGMDRINTLAFNWLEAEELQNIWDF